MKKRIFVCLITVILIISLIEFRYYILNGISPAKIFFDHSERIENEKALIIPKKLEYIFKKPFSFIGKGSQVFVFESFDKKYVIKFLKSYKYRKPFWYKLAQNLHMLSPKSKRFYMQKKNRYKKSIESYQIAAKELKDFSKVKYIQLGRKTNNRIVNNDLVLTQKYRYKQKIYLNNVAFIIQKKVSSFEKEFLKNKQKIDEKNLKEIINAFFSFMKRRYNKKIINYDNTNFIDNLGYKKGTFIHIDVGSFAFEENPNEILHFLKNDIEAFKEFLKRNNIDTTYFDKKSLMEFGI